jgi:hypothetical protein
MAAASYIENIPVIAEKFQSFAAVHGNLDHVRSPELGGFHAVVVYKQGMASVKGKEDYPQAYPYNEQGKLDK